MPKLSLNDVVTLDAVEKRLLNKSRILLSHLRKIGSNELGKAAAHASNVLSKVEDCLDGNDAQLQESQNESLAN
jgi:ABC-type transporter Mla subunit MlaD